MLPDEVETTSGNPEIRSTEEAATPGESAEQTPPALPAPPPREPFWGYTDLALVLGMLVAFLVLMVSAIGALAFVNPKLRTDPTPLVLPTQFALYAFIYLSFWLDFRSRYNRPVLSSLGWKPARINLIYCGIGGVALAFAISAVASALHTPTIKSPFDQLTNSTVSMVLFGIMAVGLGPFFEELFFRGFIQPLLTRTFGAIAGILITAVLFGSLHAPEYSWAWQYALAVSLAGAVFGWLREKTKSVIPSTVMHACFNAVSFAALTFKHTS
jgi:membrane protease YdiL (CAAX protease family)